MKIEEYKKLDKEINDNNFNTNYKSINIIMVVLSYFGNIASIFLAFFFMSRIISGAMTDSDVAVFASSVIILVFLELLKRDLFDKFSKQFIRVKSITREMAPLLVVSLVLVFFSFFSTINGAKEFSYKGAEIDAAIQQELVAYTDSLTALYAEDIAVYDEEINYLREDIKSKDKEQTEIESSASVTWTQRKRVDNIKSEKKIARDEIADYEEKIQNLEDELDNKINEKEAQLKIEANENKENNSKNSFIFIIISTIIEIVILSGIYFNEYYKFRSYKEHRERIEKDPNYQKWLLYDRILDILITEDIKLNQKVPSNKAIVDMCKVNEIIILNKDITDFMKVIVNLGIIKTSGNTKYFNKTREMAQETLRKNFNIE